MASQLSGRRVVLGLSGGVAAYKAAEFARRLMDHGVEVQAVMTEAAQKFITAATMQAHTGRPVFTDAWDARIDNAMPHITLSREAAAIVVAPATGNFIAKVAHGIADDLLSTLVLARAMPCPLFLAPAMNVEMWQNPATQRNVAQARADGAIFLGPAAGDQACGEVGMGRMLETMEMVDELVAYFRPKPLSGKRVVMTAGPTFEPIDPVRGITNRSSGKTGFAIARAACEAGARVTLVAGPSTLPTPRGVERIDVQTTLEMRRAVMQNINGADVFIAVAAVADWRVETPSASKLKKGKEASPPSLQFVMNPDILAEVAALPHPPFCVGFAAESENVIEYAKQKLIAKKLDLIVANQAQDAIGADASEMFLIDERGVTSLPFQAKAAQADLLIAEIAARMDASK